MTRRPLETIKSGNEPDTRARGLKARVILQTRSLDESYAKVSRNSLPRQPGLETGVSSLHTSFDDALLGADDSPVDSIFREREREFLADGEVSGRKHSLPQVNLETAESLQLGTVRKLPRRSSIPPRMESSYPTKTPGRQNIMIPLPSTLKKVNSTPSNPRRRRGSQHQRSSRSPFRRVTSSTPRSSNHAGSSSNKKAHSYLETPRHAAGHSTPPPSLNCFKPRSQACNTATTVNTSFDATVDTEKQENTSPSSTPFRFTSFPASLPRVNPRVDTTDIPRAPSTVRKRMSFSRFSQSAMDDAAKYDRENRDQDAVCNSSFSSISGEVIQTIISKPVPSELLWKPYQIESKDSDESGICGKRMSSMLSGDENYTDEYSYSEEESPIRKGVARTRLDFSLAISPPRSARHAESSGAVDLREPYPQHHVNSFPSTISSSTPLRRLSECGENTTISTPTMTPIRAAGPHLLAAANEQPPTPDELKFRVHLDAAQFSPILREPEDEHNPSGYNETCQMEPGASPSTTVLTSGSVRHNQDTVEGASNITSGDSPRLSLSHASLDSSNSSKRRQLRPMPDMSAFDAAISIRSVASSRVDKSSDENAPESPKLLCPPTPVRTPAWAHNEGNSHIFGRTNSLILTKVLATCPMQINDARSSQEVLVKEGNTQSYGTDVRRASHSFSTMEETMEESPGKEKGSDDSQQDKTPLLGTSPFSSPQRLFGDFPGVERNRAQLLDSKTPFASRSFASRAGEESGSTVAFAVNFQILGILGSGAFADVYKVRSKSDDKLYAVKRNRRQFRGKRDRDIALTEVRTMQRLQSTDSAESTNFGRYLLLFYRAWQEGGYFFCQTELCCRDTCRDFMDSLRTKWLVCSSMYPSLRRHLCVPGDNSKSPAFVGKLVPEPTVWKIAHDVMAGLLHMHSHGVVHNDIKPSNIFFVLHPILGAICKIGDFGLAGEIGTSEDGQEGDTVYMPPESLASGAKHTSADIFSLGLMLYELAADPGWEMPLEGPRWHELRSATHTPELPESRHPEVKALLKGMITPSPSARLSAANIFERFSMIRQGGSNYDRFLTDYIKDVEGSDNLGGSAAEETTAMEADDVGQTPRNGGWTNSFASSGPLWNSVHGS